MGADNLRGYSFVTFKNYLALGLMVGFKLVSFEEVITVNVDFVE